VSKALKLLCPKQNAPACFVSVSFQLENRWFAQSTIGANSQDDSSNKGWFAQFYRCFAQASCYVVFLL